MSEAVIELNKLGKRGFQVIHVGIDSITGRKLILLMREVLPMLD